MRNLFIIRTKKQTNKKTIEQITHISLTNQLEFLGILHCSALLILIVPVRKNYQNENLDCGKLKILLGTLLSVE